MTTTGADGLASSVAVAVDGPMLRLTLNRSHAHHALDTAALRAIRDHVRWAADDRRIRVIVIASTGERSFCAGADLAELRQVASSQARTRQYFQLGREAMDTLAAAPIPVVCRVQGAALGGGFELVLASSIVIAGEKATFGLPESRLGLIPGFGGTQRLVRALGRPAALHLMLTGSRCTASRAYELGLLAVPPSPADALDDAVDEAVAQLLAGGPEATARILDAATCGADGPLAAGLDLEARHAGAAVLSPEGQEGMSAFIERRRATFAERP